MKIIDLMKERNSEEDILLALKNIEGFDFTYLQVEDVFEMLKPVFLKRENWETYGPVSACDGVNRSMVCVQKLDDGKKYPVLYMEILVSSCGVPDKVILEINPFGCEDARGGFARVELRKNLSKEFRNFMAKDFGEFYACKNNEYFTTIKEEEVETALLDAKERIKAANKECNENIMEI